MQSSYLIAGRVCCATCHALWLLARVQGKYGKGKRQLDCAGVVMTTLAAVQRLAVHEAHADLRKCRLQVHLHSSH